MAPFEHGEGEQDQDTAEEVPIDQIKSFLLSGAELAANSSDWPRIYAEHMIEHVQKQVNPAVTVDALEQLLKETKSAHGEFEEDLGEPDKDWAGWYAQYLTARLSPDS